MPGHRVGDLVERPAASGAAEVEDRQAIWRGPGLQEALLKWLAKRMNAILAPAQVAQAIKELAMVGRQDHDFGVIAAEDRLLEPLQRQVALFA